MSNPSPERMIEELAKAGWERHNMTTWIAPCGCYFRGPWRAWTEMRGTHLADHIASGACLS